MLIRFLHMGLYKESPERPAVPIYFQRIDIEILRGAENFRQCVEHICFRRPLDSAQTFVTTR